MLSLNQERKDLRMDRIGWKDKRNVVFEPGKEGYEDGQDPDYTYILSFLVQNNTLMSKI